MSAIDASGKRVLIFGGTYRIGLSVARGFVQAGASVVVVGRSAERGASALAELESLHGAGEAHFLSADITDYAAVEATVAKAIALMGAVDVAVVSAAGRTDDPQGFRPFAHIDASEIPGYALTHWVSKAYCVKAVLPHMTEQGGGRIVLITSDAGRTPTQGESLIGGGAAATILMTRTLSKEFLRFNVTINCIAVSLTDTREGREDPAAAAGAGGQRSEFQKKMSEKLAARQAIPVTGTDVANQTIFFATDVSRSTTGQTISINGGVSA